MSALWPTTRGQLSHPPNPISGNTDVLGTFRTRTFFFSMVTQHFLTLYPDDSEKVLKITWISL